MTTKQKAVRRKFSLLELAKQMNNVSKACQIMGYSRQQFYEIRRNFQTFGADGLIDKLPGAKGPHPNRVSETIEKAVLDHAMKFPTQGPLQVANQLQLQGIQVSSGGVRGVFSRHNMNSRFDRLLRLEKETSTRKITLSDDQIKLLERFSPEFRERHIQVSFPGELVAVDTFFVGTLKGIGRIYLQTVLDCYSRYAWARFYPNKLPLTAVQIMNNDVLPFFEKHHISIHNVLSDNGREFCGRPDKHPYELFLQLEGIDHRNTKVRRPQSNGFIERFHRTLLDEHLRIQGRTKFYETIGEMQTDLDVYLKRYNLERTHQGRNMNKRTPYQVFKAGLSKNKPKKQEMNLTKKAA
jgi:transposase InsO family protein